jgi:hypothetical protein
MHQKHALNGYSVLALVFELKSLSDLIALSMFYLYVCAIAFHFYTRT